MLRLSRIWVTAAMVIALTGGSLGGALAVDEPRPRSGPSAGQRNADTALPDGWRISGKGAESQLVWRSDRRIPTGDARVEFYAGDRLLGRPEAARDGRTFRLKLVGSADLKDLQVRAAGRRLDAGGEVTKPPRDRRATTDPPALASANPVDPGKPGSYRTVTGEYTLDPMKLPGFPEPVEMQAVVVAPTGATGDRPLALFLHGRHSTCYTTADKVSDNWPCADNEQPIPSYRGYLRDQKLLASQGYVTVSISANGINAQDWDPDDGGAQARSSLVRQHLAKWADWAKQRNTAPAIVRQSPRADLDRVLLVGHSRGGEGVNRAAMDSLYRPPADQDGYDGQVRWRIRGTVLIAPTIFGQNPVADVPSVTILPGCDGDVSDLQGQIYVDGTRGFGRGTALHSAVYMVGANHNFFNSEWTPGQAQAPAWDDFYEDEESRHPDCSVGTKTRLTADQQHGAGATYIAAAAQLFVGGDDRVRPLLDGSGKRAPSADPARVFTHAVGANRTGGLLPAAGVTVKGGRLCAAADSESPTACLRQDTPGASPHFASWENVREVDRHAVAFNWSEPGSPVRVNPARPLSLGGAKFLALRVMVPPGTTGTKLDVSVTDTTGRRATLGGVSVDGLPLTNQAVSYWAQEVRVPLTAASRAGLDLRKVNALELTPRSGSGQAWLIDAWGWSAGTPKVQASVLPRVDIGRLSVPEGDSGTRTHQVPVKVSGQGNGSVRLYVEDPVTLKTDSRLVTVRPGGQSINVPVTVKGNRLFDYGVPHRIYVKAVNGAVVGSHKGGVMVQNDDPEPTVSVTPVADRVTEGESLTWRVSLSEVADAPIYSKIRFLPPDEGAELSTKDVAPQWLADVTVGESPLPERPLSELDRVEAWVDIERGELSTEFSIPTAKDQTTEPEESTRIELPEFDDPGRPQGGPQFPATVRDPS